MTENNNKAMECLKPSDTPSMAKEKMRMLLNEEFQDNKFQIHTFEIHKYPCKCVFNIAGIINSNRFDIVGTESIYYEAYLKIKNEIIKINSKRR